MLGPLAHSGGEPKHSLHLEKFRMYLSVMKAQGLTVKDGRLINDRPVGESGIAEAARLRRQMKNRYKAECIADGIGIAERRAAMFRLM